jgi:microcystin-dependent protein
MKKLISITAIALATAGTSFSQGMAINATGAAADPHAILDVASTTKGLLPPRLSATQRTTLAALLSSAQAGMIVADATSGTLFSWSGTAWAVTGNTYTASSPIAITANNIALNSGTAAGDLITWDGTNWVNSQPAVQHFSIPVDNRQPYLAISYQIATAGIFPTFCSQNPFIGEIQLYSYAFGTNGVCGFHFCDGSLLAISSNTALFSLLGINFGGNGTTTFGLPDLRGRVPIGAGTGPGLSTYSVGTVGGSESVTVSH